MLGQLPPAPSTDPWRSTSASGQKDKKPRHCCFDTMLQGKRSLGNLSVDIGVELGQANNTGGAKTERFFLFVLDQQTNTAMK